MCQNKILSVLYNVAAENPANNSYRKNSVESLSLIYCNMYVLKFLIRHRFRHNLRLLMR